MNSIPLWTKNFKRLLILPKYKRRKTMMKIIVMRTMQMNWNKILLKLIRLSKLWMKTCKIHKDLTRTCKIRRDWVTMNWISVQPKKIRNKPKKNMTRLMSTHTMMTNRSTQIIITGWNKNRGKWLPRNQRRRIKKAISKKTTSSERNNNLKCILEQSWYDYEFSP